MDLEGGFGLICLESHGIGVFGWVHRIALGRMGDFGRSGIEQYLSLNCISIYSAARSTDIV